MINFLHNSYQTTESSSGLAGGIIALIVILSIMYFIMICYAITRCKNGVQIIAVLIASLFGLIILGFTIYQLKKINKTKQQINQIKDQEEKKNRAVKELKLKYMVEKNWKEPKAELQAIKEFEKNVQEQIEIEKQRELERIKLEKIKKNHW